MNRVQQQQLNAAYVRAHTHIPTSGHLVSHSRDIRAAGNARTPRRTGSYVHTCRTYTHTLPPRRLVAFPTHTYIRMCVRIRNSACANAPYRSRKAKQAAAAAGQPIGVERFALDANRLRANITTGSAPSPTERIYAAAAAVALSRRAGENYLRVGVGGS